MARSTARLFLHVGATFLLSSVCPALAPAQTVSFTASEITGSAGPGSVAVADFNGDGKQDLAVAELNPGSVSVLLGQGDGTFQVRRTSGSVSARCVYVLASWRWATSTATGCQISPL